MQNKVNIIFTSIFRTTIIGCSIGLWFTLNVTKSSQVDKPIYTPEITPVKPGELRFDQTGKSIILVIICGENPNVNYKYEIDYKNQIDLTDRKQVIGRSLSFLSYGLMIIKEILDLVIIYNVEFIGELNKIFVEIDKNNRQFMLTNELNLQCGIN